MFDLHFLGRGAAFCPALGNTNAFFTVGDDLFFLDFGESTFEKAATRLDLVHPKQIYVLLTHLHADHAGSLASMISYTHCVLKREICVVHPLDTVNAMLRLQGIAPSFYEYAPALPKECAVQAEAIPVAHANDMQCFGYRLTDGEETIYFSGDAAMPPEAIVEAYLKGNVQRIYHDTASHPSASHCYYETLAQLIPSAQRANVWCMHLDTPDSIDTLKKLGFSVVEAMK